MSFWKYCDFQRYFLCCLLDFVLLTCVAGTKVGLGPGTLGLREYNGEKDIVGQHIKKQKNLNFLIFFGFVLSKLYTHCRTWIQNPEIQSHMLYALRQPGTPRNKNQPKPNENKVYSNVFGRVSVCFSSSNLNLFVDFFLCWIFWA